MDNLLLDAASRYTDAHANELGVAQTPFPGIAIIRQVAPTSLDFAISRPLVAILLQGRKRVASGGTTLEFGAGESLFVTTDVPTISQITSASLGRPYYSLVVELDVAIIRDLVAEIGYAPSPTSASVCVDPTGAEVADTALRLLRLLDRPSAAPILCEGLRRELHYWLFSGQHGASIRSIGIQDSHAERIGRAVSIIRNEFAHSLRVDALADVAGMSVSAFHTHFKGITSLTPIQFQKQLRLIEARRLMMSQGETIANAAYSVGYESVPQFTRDYGRMFGSPPARDLRATRGKLLLAA
jgi:AraC-like DNA-binding protein